MNELAAGVNTPPPLLPPPPVPAVETHEERAPPLALCGQSVRVKRHNNSIEMLGIHGVPAVFVC